MDRNQIALVTDSTADIPEDLVNKYNIHVVPNILILNGQSHDDGVDITREEFYNLLPGMKIPPTTATASSGTYEELYKRLFSTGAKYIISLHAASTLSGIYNAARLAATSFKNHIYVFDSQQVTLGLGFQVLTAAEAISKGTPQEKVIEIIQNLRPRARVFAMLDTLEYVRRSGRVSWARARFGNLLNFKPFVELVEGKVLSLGETRTRRRGVDRLKELLLAQGALENLAILHTNAEAEAHQFWADVKDNFQPSIVPLVVNVTTIIGVHIGPNGLGFATIVKS